MIRAINIAGAGENGIIDALHLPHNALSHQKSHALTIDKISPIMLMIVEDGIRQDQCWKTDCCCRVVYYKYRDKQEDADGYYKQTGSNYSQGEQ